MTYFTIGETIQCFLKATKDTQATTLIEENDIVNYVLTELLAQSISEATDTRPSLDYLALYQILDILALLGLI